MKKDIFELPSPCASSSDVGTTRDCLDPWQYLEISASGDVRPCCNFHPLGSLGSGAVNPEELVETEEFRELRQSLLTGELKDPCRKCHIRKSVPTTTLIDRVRNKLNDGSDEHLLKRLPLAEIRIDINEKCNLRCDYCAVSSPTYAGIEMQEEVFGNVLPILERAHGCLVHVNGHGETTFHPKWTDWCEKILKLGVVVATRSDSHRF